MNLAISDTLIERLRAEYPCLNTPGAVADMIEAIVERHIDRNVETAQRFRAALMAPSDRSSFPRPFPN